MKQRAGLLIALGVLAFVSASIVTAFFAYRTFTTTGQRAVTVRTTEELSALKLLSSINRTMSIDQVHRTLGPPSEDVYLMAKWNRFGGSILSQARVYFAGERPAKVRWIKLGFFFYEKNL